MHEIHQLLDWRCHLWYVALPHSGSLRGHQTSPAHGQGTGLGKIEERSGSAARFDESIVNATAGSVKWDEAFAAEPRTRGWDAVDQS